jgi:tRNA(Ile2) C34 agmatinyltransferase TiaS
MDDCEFTAHTKGNCRTHFFRTHCSEEINEILLHDKDEGTIECANCNKTFKSIGAFYYHCADCIPDFPETDPRYNALQALL